MDNKNRHIDDSRSSRIYDYLFGSMRKKERNALEREEQSDMFLSDALSGLEGLAEDEFLTDMKELQEKLSAKRGRRGVNRWAAVAATVLFIVGVSSLLFYLIPQDTNKIAQNRKVSAPKVEKINEGGNKEIRKSEVTEEEVKPEKRAVVRAEPVRQERVVGSRNMKSAKKPLVLNIVDDDIELDEELEISDSETVEEVKRGKVMPKAVARSAVKVSVEDAEVDYVSAPVNIEDREAEPEMGMEKYKETIKAQISKLIKDKKLKITVKLTVSAEGKVDSVEFLKTSDKSFNREVERIFKEGPDLRPAYHSGIATEEDVKIKLTIKKGKRPLSSLKT
jgi:hypothetical protein